MLQIYMKYIFFFTLILLKSLNSYSQLEHANKFAKTIIHIRF